MAGEVALGKLLGAEKPRFLLVAWESQNSEQVESLQLDLFSKFETELHRKDPATGFLI